MKAFLDHSRSHGVPILVRGVDGKHELREAAENQSGMAAAREIFGFDDNKYLPLYHTPFKETTEITITTEGDGTPVQKKVIKRERNTVRFPDRVEEVYHLLSLIFNHQWDTGPDGVALKMRFSPRLRLEGFDFIDLAAYAEQIHPKFLELKATGKGWVDFVKAPTVRAVTFFGNGFGDLPTSAMLCTEFPALLLDPPIPPNNEMALHSSGIELASKTPVQCSRHWKTLTKNKDILAITTSLLKQIANGQDGKG